MNIEITSSSLSGPCLSPSLCLCLCLFFYLVVSVPSLCLSVFVLSLSLSLFPPEPPSLFVLEVEKNEQCGS